MFSAWVHVIGPGSVLYRCDPAKSGKPYGLNAEATDMFAYQPPGGHMTATDPTAIPLQLDPEHQRMRGTAIHGNTPFDVPYISRVTDTLWQGGCADGLVLPRQVEHLVSLYPWESYAVYHELRSTLKVRMYDSLGLPDEGQLVALVRWVQECRKTGITLVHCQAGLNRSGLLAALVLMDGGMTAEKAISVLREQRSPAVLCNPAFEEYLHGKAVESRA